MKDFRKNLPKPIKILINFLLGFMGTFVAIYGILFLWSYLKAFVTMEPLSSDEFYMFLKSGIKEYGKFPRILTLLGIIVGLFVGFIDHLASDDDTLEKIGDGDMSPMHEYTEQFTKEQGFDKPLAESAKVMMEILIEIKNGKNGEED